MSEILFLSTGLLSGLLSVFVALYIYRIVMKSDEGSDRMKEVSSLIEKGANSFIKVQYRILGIFTITLAVLIALVFRDLGIPIAISYILGSLASMAAGYIGLVVATKANRRTAAAAVSGGLNPAFKVAFRAGSVMGLMIAGIALVGLTSLYWLWNIILPDSTFIVIPREAGLWEILTGFSFGASTVALFAKAGGGIFTKTADLSADLVGKIEYRIPEDDPRNPAAIADAVGDNVGDVAGTGADIYDSNVAAILAAAILGAGIDLHFSPPVPFALLPLMIAALGTLASVLGVFMVRPKEGHDPGPMLNRGTYITTLLFAILVVTIILILGLNYVIAIVAIIGLIAGVFIGFTSDVFTSERGFAGFKPVSKMVDSADKSAANLILSGYAYGLLSVLPSVLGIAVAMVISYTLGAGLGFGEWEGGIYCVAIAAVGLLSTNGMIMSSDAYGPIVDNARGIIEQAQAPKEAIVACDKLDASGNTAKAITKGFAIGASSLSVLALFAAFIEATDTLNIPGISGLVVVNIAHPSVLAGALMGSLVPVVFSAILILGVERNSERMIEEIRRQFREDPGILEGTSTPDYDKCIEIATSGAIRELMPGTLLAIIVTIATGVILGLQALAGFLGGAVLSGLIMALLMGNAGGAWDNTKKIIESPEYTTYEEGTEDWHRVHDISVTGDMVGDPFKDTAGPSINTLLVVISLTATLFLPVIAQLHLWFIGLF
ncbi:MAG: sodium-translocating pyrophosphatase [Candidatus Thorarchaeota archaeon]|nr:MAG: sodium-translocating pyrophosphatase [Candidatus Thorarchaeota archaeon]